MENRKQAVVALDLGGTKLASGLFIKDAQPLGKRAVPLEQRQGAEVAELVVREVRRLMATAARRGAAVRAVGVSVPGIAHARSGRVWAPNIPGWDDYPLKEDIRAAVSDPAVKVVVASDRAASILGEVWQGAARGCRDAIFLAVGTGIGAGILVNGRVLHGAHGIAGAIGWLALDRPFRPEYTGCGCFESHASGEGIAKVANALLSRSKSYRGPLRTKSLSQNRRGLAHFAESSEQNVPVPLFAHGSGIGSKHDVTAHDVFSAYEQDDEVAKEILSEAVEFWGMASANLVSLFNPEKIIFGGGVFGPATQFLDAIAAEARRWAQPVAVERVKFEASQLGGDAALYGAGCLALGKKGTGTFCSEDSAK